MATTAPRRRASTLKASESELTDLKKQLDILGRASALQEKDTALYDEKIQAGQRLRQSLQEENDHRHTKNAFRHLNGFHILLQEFKNIAKAHSTAAEDHTESFIGDFLQTLFFVLTAALRDHRGNQLYFRFHVDGDGWGVLEHALQEILSSRSRGIEERNVSFLDRLFGCLFSCALADDSVINLLSALRRRSQQVVDKSGSESNVEDQKYEALLAKEIDSSVILHNPMAILLALDLARRDASDSLSLNRNSVPSVILRIINRIASTSTTNLMALHQAGSLGKVVPLLKEQNGSQSDNHIQLLMFAQSLTRLGVSSLDEAQFLYREASTLPVFAKLLLKALEASRTAPYVLLDLSLHGYTSIELPSLGRPFPPLGSSAGYTLSLWFQIEKFDNRAHTTLFGAFDASQTCFLLVYIEKDTQNLILQTSITSSKPSVRFKSVKFKENKWYHMVMTHHRPKLTSSSRASLFLNGEFIEQVKSLYPASVTTAGKKDMNDGQTSAWTQKPAVQAFLGTPQDLATHLGQGLVDTRWRLTMAHLFSDVLNDDLIAVHYELGPRYTGNFQDCLGSFQTYAASAALNLRNESLHPGKEDRSDIIAAVRSKAGLLMPETSVLLSVFACVVLDDNDANNINEAQLVRSLSKSSAKNLWAVTRGRRNAVAVNGAGWSINEALLHSSGLAVLTGDPCIVVPGALDEASWQLAGGAPVGLALLEASEEDEEVITSLKILLESIQDNWRNSEAMERDNGFGVLAMLLTSKLEAYTASAARNSPLPSSSPDPSRPPAMSERVLNIILQFVGYRPDEPDESVINNPLAYRILLVDLEVWRRCSPRVQKIYFEQFVTFAVHSKYHNFNIKRLLRMRILKKWLENLKAESYTQTAFDCFLETFRPVLERGINAESMRLLSLYVTYALHKPSARDIQFGRARSLKSKGSTPIRSRTTPDFLSSPHNDFNSLSKDVDQTQMALEILKIYVDLLCQPRDTSLLHKFARTVTNKWLLHLTADDELPVVLLATKALARLLVVSGTSYVNKFVEKTGGMVILKHRLRRWWHVPSAWCVCFAILLGIDVGRIDFSRRFDLFNLLEAFNINEHTQVSCPQALPVLTSMLQQGLLEIAEARPIAASPSTEAKPTVHITHEPPEPQQAKESQGLTMEIPLKAYKPRARSSTAKSAGLIRIVIRFLADIHTRSKDFRDFASTSTYVQELFAVLFSVVVRVDPITPSLELSSRDFDLPNMNRGHIVKPLSAQSGTRLYAVVDSTTSADSSSTTAIRGQQLQPAQISEGQTVEELLELTISIFVDQIFSRKDFPGLGLFMRVPPALHEHQSYFETYILRNTVSHIRNYIRLNQSLLCEPRVLTNLARFAQHLGEAIFEGWFEDGAEDTMEFLADILEQLQLPEISSTKGVRLCTQIITNMRAIVLRIVLLRLAELDHIIPANATISFLERLAYWQIVLHPTEEFHLDLFRLLCYLVCEKLSSTDQGTSNAAADLWRMLTVHVPGEINAIFQKSGSPERESLARGFEKIIQLDNETFLPWIKDHKDQIKELLSRRFSKLWDNFVVAENHKTFETVKIRLGKRREKLRQWSADETKDEDLIYRSEQSTGHWRSNIFSAEDLKRQRVLQDQQDGQVFNLSTWSKMKARLRRPCGVLEHNEPRKWRRDLTEGRDRMRLRLVPDSQAHLHDYQPKRQQSQGPSRSRRSTDARGYSRPDSTSNQSTPSKALLTSEPEHLTGASSDAESLNETANDGAEQASKENDFELVDSPEEEPDFEDKNRKVMRSLQRGDQVEHVHNVARIVGLEAIEGLLILGKMYMYLIDSLFQRSDGEVVNSWQAPLNERDPYLQMISGRERSSSRSSSNLKPDYETRSWRWEDVLSISKRRFLFRDVAVEIFFVDGRSYLLTASKPSLRDDLYQKLLAAATNGSEQSSASCEDAWRIELLRNPVDDSQNLGSKFSSVFSSTALNPATRKWIKGEISNFHYLMIVNTMAGRTFNDLTQYPVFPWVLADYTSEDLDLTNPRSYRDLSKPMGCQTAERQAEFRDRYKSFAEMGDANSQPFHYGTHYSSAMIVTSYLIRMQPFVQSYLLLQGGSFDHPDRLFYSIEKAWTSASRDNMTDVRELIPEFFYLPDFLTNLNGYNFGLRQGKGGSIDNVALPPWAKGDPKVFIAKNREALESDYVSEHLHEWIDLVFGFKQRGDSALEATNVFHYLSYHGAKDVDNIQDPLERLATIGIIHNFGQTPHQVYPKSHPPREHQRAKSKRLDSTAESLTRLPFPMFETNERVWMLQASNKHDKPVPTGAFRLDIGPSFDKYMLWGFVDGSVRFHLTDNHRPLGLFEHVHQTQVSCAVLADSKTLITAGTDCTVSVWSLVSNSKVVDLQPRATLFGHRKPVSVLAVSRSFSALLSASLDGKVILWDLNRLDLVRVLTSGKVVECARINDVSGTIMLCRGAEISIWTLNGDVILQQDIFVEGEDQIFSCAFYEGASGEYLERNLIFTGQKRGVVNVWNVAIRRGVFVLEHVKSMHHLDQAGFNIGVPMTAILPTAHAVYTGDDDGRVYEWDCIQRQ